MTIFEFLMLTPAEQAAHRESMASQDAERTLEWLREAMDAGDADGVSAATARQACPWRQDHEPGKVCRFCGTQS